MSTPEFKSSDSNKDLRLVRVRRDMKEYKNRVDAGRKNRASFGSQEVDVKDFIISPEGWEGIMFSFYFLSIPYITGVIFLFLFIARADLENFLIFDLTAFFVVWAIGYEIVASLILIVIFVSYIKYMTKDKPIKSNRISNRSY